MNIKGWIDEILNKLIEEDITVEFYKERYYLPDASYSEKHKKVAIHGNGPSLARLGIAHLLGHELAHHKHVELYGNTGDDFSPEFKEIEREMIEKIWEICLEEHEPE